MFSLLGNSMLKKTSLLCSLQYSLPQIRFISTHHNSFTISYLINSCGLSQTKAKSASKRLHFCSPTKPDSVLTLLKQNGFSNSHISKIVSTCPSLLIYSAHKILKPKFEFFNSKGLSGADLAKPLSREGVVLGSSLDKVIIPSFDFLKSIVGTDEKVRKLLKREMGVINSIKKVKCSIAILQTHNVPMSSIEKFLVSHPRVFIRNASRFSENVEEVKKMKFDSSQYLFLMAMHLFDALSKSSFKAKVDVYKSWGWSEEQFQRAFRKQPSCMILSVENIMSTMDYFVNKFGYASSSIAEQPSVLLFSCEKRIIPRCSAMQILFENGKVKQSITLYSFLHMSEDVFLKKYISRFDKEVPGLLSTYQGKGKTG